MPVHVSLTPFLKSSSLTLHPGVLLANVYDGVQNVDLEFHVVYGLPEIPLNPQSKPHARAKHIIIRLHGLLCTPDGNILESMDAHMVQLSALRTVTLETPDISRHTGLAGKLAGLHASGKVRLRTFEEAQQVAQAAVQNPSGYTEGQGLISPVWHSDTGDLKSHREKWCVNRSHISACRSGIVTDRLCIFASRSRIAEENSGVVGTPKSVENSVPEGPVEDSTASDELSPASSSIPIRESSTRPSVNPGPTQPSSQPSPMYVCE